MSCVYRETLSVVAFKFSWLYKKWSAYIEYYEVVPQK